VVTVSLNVRVMAGGIAAWQRAGQPVERASRRESTRGSQPE
jgi:3-mercaptopyruvate sulfurtransferase SseA